MRRKMMKRVIYINIVLTVLTFNNTVSAQQRDAIGTFKLSFMKVFNYPQLMRDSCISTAAIIRITKVKTRLCITLSDSANELFKQELEKVSSKLNTSGIVKMLKNSKKDNCILIPVYFSLDADYCTNQISISVLASKYNRFNGQYFTGNCIISEPIIVRISRPIIN